MNGDVSIAYLTALSHTDAVLKGPWGIGDELLMKNSESWAPYLRFLYNVVSENKPAAVLECGVYMGTATRHMALGCRDTVVIGVDREFHPDFTHNVVLPNIKTIRGDSTHIRTKQIVERHLNGRPIELMFIDSTHDGDTPRMEFDMYSDLFGDVCIVVCDDLIGPEHLHKKMEVFWSWLPGEKTTLHHLHPRHNASQHDIPGFGVSIVRR